MDLSPLTLFVSIVAIVLALVVFFRENSGCGPKILSAYIESPYTSPVCATHDFRNAVKEALKDPKNTLWKCTIKSWSLSGNDFLRVHCKWLGRKYVLHLHDNGFSLYP